MITIYACAQQAPGSKLTGCALACQAVLPDQPILDRRMGFPTGVSTLNMASASAVLLAAASLRNWAADMPIAIIHDSSYVDDMLKKVGGKYVKEPQANAEAIVAMRKAVESLKSATVTREKFSYGMALECATAAKSVATSQRAYDDGTREIADDQGTHAEASRGEG